MYNNNHNNNNHNNELNKEHLKQTHPCHDMFCRLSFLLWGFSEKWACLVEILIIILVIGMIIAGIVYHYCFDLWWILSDVRYRIHHTPVQLLQRSCQFAFGRCPSKMTYSLEPEHNSTYNNKLQTKINKTYIISCSFGRVQFVITCFVQFPTVIHLWFLLLKLH